MHLMAIHCNDAEFWRVDFDFKEVLLPTEFNSRITLHKIEGLIASYDVFLTRNIKSTKLDIINGYHFFL